MIYKIIMLGYVIVIIVKSFIKIFVIALPKVRRRHTLILHFPTPIYCDLDAAAAAPSRSRIIKIRNMTLSP